MYEHLKIKNQVFNPYLPPYEYCPDGEPYVFDGRVYVYGCHDRYGSNIYCSDHYVLWSADVDDLSNWHDHGVIYRREQDPMHHTNSNHLHAPDVAKGYDGRYYLYYPNLYALGVAVSDTPHGPFAYYGRVCYSDGSVYGLDNGKDIRAISADDPAVLCDDDGRIWLYTGYVPSRLESRKKLDRIGRRYCSAYCVELEKDMLTVKGEPKPVAPGKGFAAGTSFEGNEFYEASGIRKIDGIYYFVYSSFRSHDLCYATSRYPDRDFTFRGVLVSCIDHGISPHPAAIPGNTHGNLVKIKDKWYIFYHRTCGSCYVRQGCAEEIVRLQDGSFLQAEITSCGLNGKPLAASGSYSAHIACNLWNRTSTDNPPTFMQDGADGEVCRQYITNMTDNCWVGYKYFDFDGHPTKLTIFARGTGKGNFIIATSPNGKASAQLSVTESVGWCAHSVECHFTKGAQPLFIGYTGEGSAEILEFQFDAIK